GGHQHQKKKKKLDLLSDVSEFISRHHWFKEELFEDCLRTISVNLFRALPYQFRPPTLMFFHEKVFDKETTYEDPSWRHVKLAYDLLWRIINSNEVTAAIMEKYMPGSFLRNFVELFGSEDGRERGYVTMILHKMYGRCLKLRTHIIDLISYYLLRIIYSPDTEHFNGVTELLQIICSIIPGLTVPVKDSWQKFLRIQQLIPKKKNKTKVSWSSKILGGIDAMLRQLCGERRPRRGNNPWRIASILAEAVPREREIFIMEVVNIINVLLNHQDGFDFPSYKQILMASAEQLTQCMRSTRQPVAERAIAAWKEVPMQQLVDYDRKSFLPPLIEAFFWNRNHPNQQFRLTTQNVEKIYRNKDVEYWKEMQQYLTKKEAREKDAEEATCRALAYGKLPPFPFKVGNRYTNVGKEVADARVHEWMNTGTSSSSVLSTDSKNTEPESIEPLPSDLSAIPSTVATTINESLHPDHLKPNDTRHSTVAKKRAFDSFVIFTLEKLNEIEYSPLVPRVKKFERENAHKRSRYLTKVEKQVLFYKTKNKLGISQKDG
ncbi:hypothetical protein RFI_15596, partial [Reticulomyxa filosa]